MSANQSFDDDIEISVDPRVARLLEVGAPANGIELSGWWRENARKLADMETKPSQPMEKKVGRSLRNGAMILAMGVALGVFLDRWAMGAAQKTGCPYNSRQKVTAEMAMAADQKSGSATVGSRVASLTVCAVCHHAAGRPAHNKPEPIIING